MFTNAITSAACSGMGYISCIGHYGTQLVFSYTFHTGALPGRGSLGGTGSSMGLSVSNTHKYREKLQWLGKHANCQAFQHVLRNNLIMNQNQIETVIRNCSAEYYG